jgi:hypothetical protein
VTEEVSKPRKLRPIPFGERPGKEPYNASEVVALSDSRFLFCDNNVNDAFFELRLAPDGSMASPLVRRAIKGIEPGAIDDMEGMELVTVNGRTFLFATSSLSLKRRKKHHKKKAKRGKPAASRESVLRIRINDDQELEAESIPDFRSWLIEQAPELTKPARYLPDDGGLNVEALSWDPNQQALLFGLRTPVVDRSPLIVRVRIKQFDGPWDLGNLEILPPITLPIETSGRRREGLRAMTYDPANGAILLTVGRRIKGSKRRFELYSWDGQREGLLRNFRQVRFARRMRVEGVAHGTVAGRGAVVFVDDRGGYQLLWDDDPRLAVTEELTW